ncbi:methyl-accepting chemotaxis protein [Desulfococcaceae bacterium HSG8]|nr:methyl-accepting chemotaxis protein [Desulfococcaceae bacterium HSG8]
MNFLNNLNLGKKFMAVEIMLLLAASFSVWGMWEISKAMYLQRCEREHIEFATLLEFRGKAYIEVLKENSGDNSYAAEKLLNARSDIRKKMGIFQLVEETIKQPIGVFEGTNSLERMIFRFFGFGKAFDLAAKDEKELRLMKDVLEQFQSKRTDLEHFEQEFLRLIGEVGENSAEFTIIVHNAAMFIRNLMISLSVFFLAVATAFLFILAGMTISPLARLTEFAQKIARGDLSQPPDIKQRDEIGMMADAFQEISEIQRKRSEAAAMIATGDLTAEVEIGSDEDMLGNALRDMTRSLNSIMEIINEASLQVASGSKQVSESSQSVSKGANDQASSLEQATSSMIEIGSQTRANAENASQASQLASQSRELAEKGTGEMGNMVTAMEDIRDASQSISKIIKVIDEIAFQTNLLALNAAVEAARAGRYGKGFAVVAEEVRNLAGRSARAAKETAELIESAVEKVEKGSEIADQTASALNKIAEAAIKVAELVSEIAASCNEQARGISQVNQGLGQIDQVTQQNTANTEETASAAEELYGQASQLRQVIAQFRLKADYRSEHEFDTDLFREEPHFEANPFPVAGESVASAKSESGRLIKPIDNIPFDDTEFEKY